jgi:hypothetical protein
MIRALRLGRTKVDLHMVVHPTCMLDNLLQQPNRIQAGRKALGRVN